MYASSEGSGEIASTYVCTRSFEYSLLVKAISTKIAYTLLFGLYTN